MKNGIKTAVFFLLVFLATSVFAANFPERLQPYSYVNDYTHILSANEKAQLENKLVRYGQETSSQIAVVLVPSTDEYAISDYAFRLGDKWGIGRQKLNNGVLMLVAMSDRKVFIAVGQGLEGVLPDAFLSQVIRHNILPYFKQGNYAQGISDGLDQVIAASKGEFDAAAQQEDWTDKYIPLIMVVLFILFVLFGEISWRRPYVSPTNNHQMDEILRQTARRRGNAMGYGTGLGGRNDPFRGGSSGGFGGGSGGFGGGNFGGGGAGGSW